MKLSDLIHDEKNKKNLGEKQKSSNTIGTSTCNEMKDTLNFNQVNSSNNSIAGDKANDYNNLNAENKENEECNNKLFSYSSNGYNEAFTKENKEHDYKESKKKYSESSNVSSDSKSEFRKDIGKIYCLSEENSNTVINKEKEKFDLHNHTNDNINIPKESENSYTMNSNYDFPNKLSNDNDISPVDQGEMQNFNSDSDNTKIEVNTDMPVLDNLNIKEQIIYEVNKNLISQNMNGNESHYSISPRELNETKKSHPTRSTNISSTTFSVSPNISYNQEFENLNLNNDDMHNNNCNNYNKIHHKINCKSEVNNNYKNKESKIPEIKPKRKSFYTKRDISRFDFVLNLTTEKPKSHKSNSVANESCSSEEIPEFIFEVVNKKISRYSFFKRFENEYDIPESIFLENQFLNKENNINIDDSWADFIKINLNVA